METDQAHVADVVDGLLVALAAALPLDARGELEEPSQVIRRLLVPKDDFSVEDFVSSEVAHALED